MTPQEALVRLRSMAKDTAWILHARDVLAVLDSVDGTPEAQLPAVPGRGDRVRILFRLPAEEGGGTTALAARLLEQATSAGIWWSPEDDARVAEFTPIAQIEAITCTGPAS